MRTRPRFAFISAVVSGLVLVTTQLPASADRIVGTAGDDTLRGTAGKDHLDGRGGDDLLVGRDGRDSLLGRSGDDTAYGGRGGDYFDGGRGRDAFKGGPGPDSVFDHLVNGHGNASELRLGVGADSVLSNVSSDGRVDVIYCGPGEDTVSYWGDPDPRDRLLNCEHVNDWSH